MNFFKLFCELKSIEDAYFADKSSKLAKQNYIDFIKKVFVFHWKILRDLLSEQTYKIFYPREIFILAQEKDIINNANIWIKYIDKVNDLINSTNIQEQENIVNQIIFEYSIEIKKLKSFYQNMLIIKDDLADVSNNHPNCNITNNNIGINEESYSILMNFINNTPEINKVWIYGSRASGNYRIASDIDLIIDSQIENFDSLVEKINRLRIPYRCDCKNLNDKTDIEFIEDNLKKSFLIYSKKD